MTHTTNHTHVGTNEGQLNTGCDVTNYKVSKRKPVSQLNLTEQATVSDCPTCSEPFVVGVLDCGVCGVVFRNFFLDQEKRALERQLERDAAIDLKVGMAGISAVVLGFLLASWPATSGLGIALILLSFTVLFGLAKNQDSRRGKQVRLNYLRNELGVW